MKKFRNFIAGFLFLSVFLMLIMSISFNVQGQEEHYIYMPIVAKAPLTLTIDPVELTCGSNDWNVTWSGGNNTVNEYVFEEAHNADFISPEVYATTNTFIPFEHAPSTDNLYYYQVRADGSWGQGPWSNTQMVVGGFLDVFSDPATGWSTGNTDEGIWSYDSGVYSITTKKTGHLIASPAPDVARNGYSAEVDVQWANGSTTDGLYALVFGGNADFSSYYFLAIRPDSQFYRLYFFNSDLPISDRLRPITPWTTSEAIHNNGHINHLKVVRVGAEIQVTINGTTMGTWADSAQTGATYAGVMVTSNPNNPTATALFDNFSLTTCDTVAIQQSETKQQPMIQPDSNFSVNQADIGW